MASTKERVRVSKDFYLDEYLPRRIYEAWPVHVLIGMIDRRLVESDQKLRDAFGTCVINTWWDGGVLEFRGLRTKECDHFSEASQHTFGRASDKTFLNYHADEVRAYIQSNYIWLGITSIEAGVTWVHSDVRYVRSGELLIFYP